MSSDVNSVIKTHFYKPQPVHGEASNRTPAFGELTNHAGSQERRYFGGGEGMKQKACAVSFQVDSS